MPVQPRVVDKLVVEQADRTWPVLVMFGRRGACQPDDRLGRRRWAGVSTLADDSTEAVLSYCTRRPAVDDLGADPPANTLVVDVIAVEQCDKDIDVQQCTRQTASSSRSRSMRALDTADPRCSKGSKP